MGKSNEYKRAVKDGGIKRYAIFMSPSSTVPTFAGDRSYSLHCGLQIWRRLHRLNGPTILLYTDLLAINRIIDFMKIINGISLACGWAALGFIFMTNH